MPQPFAGDIDLPSTAWHAEWDDVNNDGRVDLYVAKGNVEQMPDHAAEDPSNLLIGQPDGTWEESAIEAGIVHFDKTRGAALADLNLDGLLDLVEVNRGGPGAHLAQRRCRHGHRACCPWVTGWPWSWRRTDPTARPSAPGSRSRAETASSGAR